MRPHLQNLAYLRYTAHVQRPRAHVVTTNVFWDGSIEVLLLEPCPCERYYQNYRLSIILYRYPLTTVFPPLCNCWVGELPYHPGLYEVRSV